MTALPTFFVIGAPKAGTTSLHSYLDRHSQVQMSAVKEPRFFASRAGNSDPSGRIADLADYERLFDPAFAVRGESSTDYSTYPRWLDAPERIAALVPDARFVYLVRDPVSRAVSHYRMRVALMGERRPPSEAFGHFASADCPYLVPSLYATQLERYLRLFPQERVLVVDQSDLLNHRSRTLESIFAFLGVAQAIDYAQFDDELLIGREWRAYPTRYAGMLARVAPHIQWIPGNLRHSARRAVERALWPPLDTVIGDELAARLRKRLAPEAARLRALTGAAFPSWSV